MASAHDVFRDDRLIARVFEQSQSGLVLHDGTGHTVARNERAPSILGVDPESWDDYHFQTINGDAVVYEQSPLGRAVAGEDLARADLCIGVAAGPPRRVRIAAERFEDHDGDLVAVLVTLVDLSEIEAAEALQKEVFGVVGHDLRNPLSAIRMTAQLLARPAPMTDERRKELAERVLSASKRMDNLVGALLDYARAKGGATVALAREPIDLDALVRRLVSEQEQHPSAAGRAFSVTTRGTPTGSWDPGRLTQIITNLVANAVLHGDANTSIEVDVDGTDADVVRLGIHNVGPSIPPDLQGVVFQPFKTGRSSTRRGMGLGLFVVKQMVEAHGGAVSLTSADPEGTTFTVTLPRAASR